MVWDCPVKVAGETVGVVGRVAILSLLVLLAASGCQPRREEWTKPGATGGDLRRDLADCEREAMGPPPFRFWALNESYESARDQIAQLKGDCMMARGWRLAADALP
jgi:hypothetical protein